MIRVARAEDAAQLLRIYSWYVKNTAITFEYDVPSEEEFRERIHRTLERYPYLVYEEEGTILGYAYVGVFHARAAYNWDVETSIYVDHDRKRGGIGRKLYEALEKTLALQHVINLYACIASPETEDEYLTRDSIRYHTHMGYRMVGEFKQCGYKFGRWYNMSWMEKAISEHPDNPQPFLPFGEIREELDQRYGIK